MESLFACPPPTALASIPSQACPEQWDQILRFGFQRIQTTASFTASTILLSATWTALLTATDSTKMVISPRAAGIVIPPGDVLKEGGNDNSTVNGIPRLVGRGNVTITANLQNVQAAVRTALRALVNESALSPGYTNLWAYPINRFGQVIASLNGTAVEGIPVYNVYVGDTGSDGFGKDNINHMSMDLAGGWSDAATIYKPTAFNPLNL